MVGILIAVIIGIILFFKSCNCGSSNLENDAAAYNAATAFVKENLKAPSTADFAGYLKSHIYKSDDLWIVKSYVDAQNGFGANIRTHFICKVSYNKYSEKWKLEELQFVK